MITDGVGLSEQNDEIPLPSPFGPLIYVLPNNAKHTSCVLYTPRLIRALRSSQPGSLNPSLRTKPRRKLNPIRPQFKAPSLKILPAL